MTLLPAPGVRGHPGKIYDVNEICAVPGCGALSAHAHHLWSRSFLRGQPYEWVQLPDGTVLGNRVGLCFTHHEWVTGPLGGYKARILFSSGVFWWEVRVLNGTDNVYERVGMLLSQPPGTTRREPQASPDPETCPTCGKPKRKTTPLPARKAKTWTVTVPDDSEIGADVLDGWVDDIAAILGFEDEASRLRRYHVLCVSLAWLAQNRDMFKRDIAEAAERLA